MVFCIELDTFVQITHLRDLLSWYVAPLGSSSTTGIRW